MGRREEAELGPSLGDCGSALFYFFGGKILVFSSYAWGWGGGEKGLWVCNLGDGGGQSHRWAVVIGIWPGLHLV